MESDATTRPRIPWGFRSLLLSAVLTGGCGYLLAVYGVEGGPLVSLPLFVLIIIVGFPLYDTAKKWRPMALTISLTKFVLGSLVAYWSFGRGESFVGVLFGMVALFSLIEVSGRIATYSKQRAATEEESETAN